MHVFLYKNQVIKMVILILTHCSTCIFFLIICHNVRANAILVKLLRSRFHSACVKYFNFHFCKIYAEKKYGNKINLDLL